MALTRRRTDTAIQVLHFNEHSDDPYTRAGLLLDYSRVLLKYIISKRYTLQAICLILKHLLKSMLYRSSKPHCLFPFYMSFPNFAQRNAMQLKAIMHHFPLNLIILVSHIRRKPLSVPRL